MITLPEGDLSAEPKSSQQTPHSKRIKKLFRRVFLWVWLPLVALFCGYLVWSYRADGFDRRILESNPQVTVDQSDIQLSFQPVETTKSASLIFIPGALVQPTAYAPLAHSLATEGYPVHIVRLPFRYPFTRGQREAVAGNIRQIITQRPPETKWILAGHSYGAAFACRFVRDSPGQFAGLALLGSSHPRDFSLDQLQIKVMKIFATNDGLASVAKVDANRRKLPADTRWVEIRGGNHSQFGYYGFQFGDRRATITRAAQQAEIKDALADFSSQFLAN